MLKEPSSLELNGFHIECNSILFIHFILWATREAQAIDPTKYKNTDI